MDKYEGMNKPDVVLCRNAVGKPEKCENAGKRGRLKSFLLRGALSALLLGFIFLPRFFPYKGSDKVTETVKTVIMTDITGSESVGEGKLIDIFRGFFGDKDDDAENEDEKE